MTETLVPVSLKTYIITFQKKRCQLQQDPSLECIFLRNQTHKHKRNVGLDVPRYSCLQNLGLWGFTA